MMKVNFQGQELRVTLPVYLKFHWILFRLHGMKRIHHLLLMPFEWLGIALAVAVMTNLSHCSLLSLCDVISRVMLLFDRRGRNRAHELLTLMFGSRLTRRRERLIVRRSYRNMSRTVGHVFWTLRSARKRVAVAGEMSQRGREFLAANRPAVTVSGHIGCWEILSQLAFLEGHAMMSVAKNIGTSGMTRLLMRARKSIGQEIIPAAGAFKPLMAGIRAGKSLGLLVDQSVSPKDGGVWVRFLGRPISVSAAPGFFAAKGHAPIVVAWSRPLKDGRYRCEVVDEIMPDSARDIWQTTQRCARDIERIVRRHPSAWVLNYNYFSNEPTKNDIATLTSREESAQ